MQFSLRGVLILITLVAICLGWYLKQIREAEVRALIEQLGAENRNVRAQAACALPNLGRSAALALPQMVELLADTEWAQVENRSTKVANFVADALVEMGPLASAEVLRALDHPDREIRAQAIEILGRLREPLAVESLVGLLAGTDRELCGHACSALKRIGGPAVDPLVRGMWRRARPSFRITKRCSMVSPKTRSPQSYVGSGMTRMASPSSGDEEVVCPRRRPRLAATRRKARA